MPVSVSDLLAAAQPVVPKVDPHEAQRLVAEEGALLLDVRDAPELAPGKLQGALHVPRGMLEFRADPAMPQHDPAFSAGCKVVVYCASGGRAVLSGKTLRDMGYEAYNLGAFKDAVEAGFPTEAG